MNWNSMKILLSAMDTAAADIVFAEFISRCCGGADPVLMAAAALAVRAVRNGDSCIALADIAGKELASGSAGEHFVMPEQEEMLDILLADKHAGAVSAWDGCSALPLTPLVVDSGGRLYLQRYLFFEKSVAEEILMRCGRERLLPVAEKTDMAGLLDFFALRAGEADTDYQQMAVFAALHSSFTVISGGPGTGKTTVVSALLALELMRNPELKIMLCAPTGKAQARLQESLHEGIGRLHISDELKSRLGQLPCSTIHSMLKLRRNSHEFHFCKSNPLPCDLLVVDECSMVSLPLMSRMLSALLPSCRVVMLGDKDQLSSVETGAVMADICSSGTVNTLPQVLREAFRENTGWDVPAADDSLPLNGSIAELTGNHRFASAPSIGEISYAVRTANTDNCGELSLRISAMNAPDFRTRDLPPDEFSAALSGLLDEKNAEGYALADLPSLARKGGRENLELAFRLLNSFKILAAIQSGPRGVAALNELVREKLGLHEPYAAGVPLMVTENNWQLGLFNGDIGLVWQMHKGVRPMVYFPGVDRGFAPSELPSHQTVFAMTVHKSQGSGFSRVLLVMPDRMCPVLTGELFYTAVTRAEKYAEIWGSAEVIQEALCRRTRRISGLAARLRGQ